MNKIVSLFCGIVFGIGLVISEMINPAKVLGFLNLFDQWDPSLAFVMVGALIVSTPLYHLFKNKDKPLFNSNFSILTNCWFCCFWWWLGIGRVMSWASNFLYSLAKHQFCYFRNINVRWFLYSFKIKINEKNFYSLWTL